MEETNTLLNSEEALKPILELAQQSATANISTIRAVVLKALSDPKIFCGFDEIKQVLQPALTTSTSGESEAILRTLDLFSYGNYNDYSKAQDQYLSLTENQIFKLRQLTVLTLVQQACNSNTGDIPRNSGCVVPYHKLATELGFSISSSSSSLPNEESKTGTNTMANAGAVDESVLRQVEEVVLACVYARVVAGQLCQKSMALYVTSRNGPPCRPRDVPLLQGAAMLEILQHFHQTKLVQARVAQDQIQQAVQIQLDSNRNYQRGVMDKIKKAETTSVGSAAGSNPAFIGAGGSVRGWPEGGGGGQDERRLSDMGGSARGSTSSRRQTKRSRGGGVGAMDAFSRY